MNYSINHAGFVEMILNSNDDYEPYGCNSKNANQEDRTKRQLSAPDRDDYDSGFIDDY